MRELPLISVIVPTYNCAPYLAIALDSVFSQDWPSLEVIVCDDGSADDTVAIARRYADRGLTVLQQANGGPAKARNRAVAASRGEYLAFIDGDDFWMPGKLRAQMSAIADAPARRIVYGGFGVWSPDVEGRFAEPETFADGEGLEVAIDPRASGWIYPELLLDSEVHIITALIHREVFDRVGGFDETLRTGSDYDFWIRASRHFEMTRLARCVALYRTNPQSISFRPQPVNNAYVLLTRAVERYGFEGPDGRMTDVPAFRRRLAMICFNFAWLHFQRGDRRIAARAFRDAVRARPANARAWWMWARASFGR
jgi:glycosyltransferase involved in cell wall biosynthesis